MSERNSRSVKVQDSLALAGAVWGLVAWLALVGFRVSGGTLPPIAPDGYTLRAFLSEWTGTLGFLAVYLAPFLLAWLARRWQAPAQRAAAWLGGAALAIMLSFTALSGVTLLLLPAALLLALAAALAWAQARGWRLVVPLAAVWLAGVVFTFLYDLNLSFMLSFFLILPAAPLALVAILDLILGRGRRPLVPLAALGLAVVGALAWLSLFSVEAGQCWDRVRLPSGRVVWQASAFSTTGELPANIAEDEPGVVKSTCAGDVNTFSEGALALALLFLGGLGLRWLLPRWEQAPAAQAGEIETEDG